MKKLMSVVFGIVLVLGANSVLAQGCGCGPEPVCDPCAKKICTPFNGFFLELFSRPCCAPVCEPCAPACAPAPVCAPCAPAPVPVCEPVCAPCAAVSCDPCGPVCDPCCRPAPFNGFFRNLLAPCKPACGGRIISDVPVCTTPAPACSACQ